MLPTPPSSTTLPAASANPLTCAAVIWDVEVPSDAIDVTVAGGWVKLKGYVDYQFQSDAAFIDLAPKHGVDGLASGIKVVNPCR